MIEIKSIEGLLFLKVDKTDLSDADLIGADLYGANLYGANLSGADLSGATDSNGIIRIIQFDSRGWCLKFI